MDLHFGTRDDQPSLLLPRTINKPLIQ
ncbi:hypothetical protein D021_3089A, partial [Vibrio parahaemolyticus 10296]